MAAIDARSLTLKISDGQDPEEFNDIGGLQSIRLTLRNATNNHHHADMANGWNETIAETGLQQLTLQCNGTFTDSETEQQLRAQAFANSRKNYQIELGNGDLATGAFCITNFDRSAEMEGAIHYQFTLQSAGEITYISAG